jgi:hypothetical protein
MQRPGPRNRLLNRDPRTAKSATEVSSWLNFTPLSLSPAVWYDASDTTTITASLGAVSQWDDKSGNGRHLTQATGISQPTTGSVTRNNLNVISFDGINDVLDRTENVLSYYDANGTDVMFAAVALKISTELKVFIISASNTNRLLFDQRTTASFFDAPSATTARVQLGSSWSTNTFGLWSGYRLGSQMALRLNGQQLGSRANASGAASSSSQTFSIMREIGFSFSSGYYCELVIVPKFSYSGLINMERYLTRKWGPF